MRYAIVIEKAEGNYSAYVPDYLRRANTGARDFFPAAALSPLPARPGEV